MEETWRVSSQVPIVQELAKQPVVTVPPRYVRPVQDPPFVSNSVSLPRVPIINTQCFLSGDSMDLELEKLHFACKEWGFFQLINHGVDSSLVEKVKSGIEAFFNLPIQEKKKLKQESGDVEGYGQAFVVSEEPKLDWAVLFYVVTLPPHLRKPNLFNKLPLSFRDTIEAYSAEMKTLAMKIINLMAKALQMDSRDMKNLFEEGMQAMRMNYYPKCPQPELVIGFNAHSDAVGLTILLQINEKDGLQIKKDGLWIPLNPLPNSFIVNVGDVLEIVTNGIYRRIEHRVTVNSEKERLSIATFLSPKLDGDLGPAPPENPALFKRIGVADYFRGFFTRKLAGKSYVDVIRIQNEIDTSN